MPPTQTNLKVMSVKEIPFLNLQSDKATEAMEIAIKRVLKSGSFVLGAEVEEFEQEFAAASSLAQAVGVGNGTDALSLILKGLNIGPGDEVITTPLSAAFTAMAIVMVGATPVFADIDAERLTLAPSAVSAAIGPKTAAILPVHLFGQAAEMPAIMHLARRHGLAVVEDCCQAHLATCQGRPVGTFGSGGAFSFYPTKNLGAIGDGGIVGTNDTALADKIRRLRNGGQSLPHRHESMGVNSRLDEIQAAVLRAKLPFLRQWTERRRSLAAFYRTNLNETSVRIPAEVDAGHVYHLFPVHSTERNRLQEYLKSNGIYTLIHYPTPIPQQPAFADYKVDCPTANRLCNELLSLPLHPNLTDSQIQLVALTVSRFVPTSV
ncbi:MAG: erythromycin biosynthesis sensory transduction protein eryC1 [Woeseiaceae bacterium]|nr:erythromycin biosynthesis sensory transduction protein eryC1 [Woeseiaceae bacterium]